MNSFKHRSKTMKANYSEARRLHDFPCYILTGSEAFQKKKLINKILENYKNKAFEIIRASFPEQPYHTLYQQESTLSLFATSRLFKLDFTKAPDKQGQSTLIDHCTKIAKTDRYLLIFDELNYRQQKNKWFQSLCHNALHIHLWPATIPESIHLLKEELQTEYKLTLSGDAIRLIAQKTEGNLLAAEQILRLLSMQGDGHFDCTAIGEFIDNFMNYDVFDLTQSITRQNLKRSLMIYAHLFTAQVAPAIILWAIIKEIKLWIQLSQNAPGERQKIFTANNIWRARQPLYTTLIGQFSPHAYQKLMAECLEIDFVIKGVKKGNIRHMIGMLICHLHPNLSR